MGGEEVDEKMSMIQEVAAESGFLRVVVRGSFSLVEAKRTFMELLEAVARAGVRKVLLDGRRLAGNPKSLERFYYGEFAAEAVAKYADRGVPRSTQFAYVLNVPVLDPRRFGETVAVNRGMNVKAFDSLDDAFRWLEITPAKDLDEDDDK
jgi:hypothetical protein